MRKIYLIILIFILLIISSGFSRTSDPGDKITAEASPEKGFYWSYLLWIPDTTDMDASNLRFLVIPNNTGRDFKKTELRKGNIYFFLGGGNKNDSVTFDDSYDEAERKAVLDCFGDDIQERWMICRDIYEKNNYKNLQFRLYEGIGIP